MMKAFIGYGWVSCQASHNTLRMHGFAGMVCHARGDHSSPHTSLVEPLKQDITADILMLIYSASTCELVVWPTSMTCTCELIDLVDPTEYLAKLPAVMEPLSRKLEYKRHPGARPNSGFHWHIFLCLHCSQLQPKYLENVISQLHQDIGVFGVRRPVDVI